MIDIYICIILSLQLETSTIVDDEIREFLAVVGLGLHTITSTLKEWMCKQLIQLWLEKLSGKFQVNLLNVAQNICTRLFSDKTKPCWVIR